jgi:hypothetical protein
VSRILVKTRSSPARCAICHDTLDATPFVCDRCAVALHAGCHADLPRCPTLGCRGVVRVSVAHETPRARRPGNPIDAFFTVLVLAAVSISTPLRPREHGNTGRAIGSLRTIAASQVIFHERKGRFAHSIEELDRAGLIDETLGSGTKHGYRYVVGAGPGECWTATAAPVSRGEPFNWFLFVSEEGLIRWSLDGPANAASLPLPR